MKTVKLLFLGGLFTLVGVFNFSSAWDIEYSYSPRGSNIERGLTCSFDNSEIYRKCCIDTVCSDFQTSTIVVSGLKKVDSSVLCPDSDYPYLSDYILLNDGGPLLCYGTTDVMPVSKLTPVVDGLKNSINEFIPYVVYIGLGILGVIIGFVAIKWLMRWVKGKSLGTFNSRRRK